MIIECIDNQEAETLIEYLVPKGFVYDYDYVEGGFVFVCECGCNRLYTGEYIDSFDEDFPSDAGFSVVTTNELRERIAAEDTGEPESGEGPGAMYSLSEMQPDEVLREPTDGDVRVPQSDLRSTWQDTSNSIEYSAPTTWISTGPRTERHEQTRRLQQEYQRVLDEAASQRILDEAAERHRSDTEWVIVDDTSGT